jgi:hypothetical protein
MGERLDIHALRQIGWDQWDPIGILTRNQVDLMREDNVTRTGMQGLVELDITPVDIDQVVRMIERQK